jgi:hypothetical protein
MDEELEDQEYEDHGDQEFEHQEDEEDEDDNMILKDDTEMIDQCKNGR